MVKQDKEANSPTEKTQRYETLCTAVEQSLHRKMIAQTDFDFLVEAIYTRTRELLSATTLKRLWGKVQSDYTPSAHTLNILAQFLGYSDFDGFCQHQQANDTPPSNPVLSEHIDVEKDINIGDEITLYWAPGRVCHIRYLGQLQFVVIESEMTRLQPGDTFSCNVFINGEPLYLKNLRQAGHPPFNYVCGMKGGIRYERSKQA
jgi:hypothetical protein